MDFPFHFRALDPESKTTIRQSTVAFKTAEAAQVAADHATRMHGDEHVVCVSLDPTDPENKPFPGLEGKPGFKVYKAPKGTK